MASPRHVAGRTAPWGIILSLTVIKHWKVGGGGTLSGRFQQSVKPVRQCGVRASADRQSIKTKKIKAPAMPGPLK